MNCAELVYLFKQMFNFFYQISRHIQLKPDGRLEQTVSMALEGQPLTQHLHITYRRTD